MERIRANRFQPRKHFDDTALSELAQSLRSHGMLQPVVVRETAAGFELISGERRWRAAKLAGLTAIPALIRPDVSDQEMLELALVENVQREDLDAIERAHGFRSMMAALKITQEEVAKKVGLQRATVANHLRLLDLPQEVQDAVSKGLVSMGHARAILALGSARLQLDALERAVREGLSVRQLEGMARVTAAATASGQPGARKTITPHQPWIAEIEGRLRESLGTKVAIQNSRGYRGRIVIEYFDRASLERIYRALAPAQALD